MGSRVEREDEEEIVASGPDVFRALRERVNRAREASWSTCWLHRQRLDLFVCTFDSVRDDGCGWGPGFWVLCLRRIFNYFPSDDGTARLGCSNF